MAAEDEGASNNERLLAACKDDQPDLLSEIISLASYDINCRNSVGNSPLHLASLSGSTSCLEILLKQPKIHLNPQNAIDHDTPLHLAAANRDMSLAAKLIDLLTEAGSDPRIRNKRHQKPIDLIDLKTGQEARKLLQSAEMAYQTAKSDLPVEDDDGSASDASD